MYILNVVYKEFAKMVCKIYSDDQENAIITGDAKMKMNKIVVLAVSMAMVFGLSGRAFAAVTNAASTVNIVVPAQLGFTADLSSITLTFSDYLLNSETDIKDIVYTVKANTLTKLVGAVSGKMDAVFTGADLKAKAGTYTNVSGNAALVATNADYITLTAASQNLMNKTAGTGNGKTVRGNFPISYKAIATADLSPDSNQTQTVTITLADA